MAPASSGTRTASPLFYPHTRGYSSNSKTVVLRGVTETLRLVHSPEEKVSIMYTNDVYTKLNAALINAGMDPAKAMKDRAKLTEFRNLCLGVGTTPAAMCEAAGL